jgi:hypothetical protein
MGWGEGAGVMGRRESPWTAAKAKPPSHFPAACLVRSLRSLPWEERCPLPGSMMLAAEGSREEVAAAVSISRACESAHIQP